MISLFKKMFKFNVFQSVVSKATTTVWTWRWKVWKKTKHLFPAMNYFDSLSPLIEGEIFFYLSF